MRRQPLGNIFSCCLESRKDFPDFGFRPLTWVNKNSTSTAFHTIGNSFHAFCLLERAGRADRNVWTVVGGPVEPFIPGGGRVAQQHEFLSPVEAGMAVRLERVSPYAIRLSYWFLTLWNGSMLSE